MNKLRELAEHLQQDANMPHSKGAKLVFSERAAELRAILPEVERLIEALRDANDECRSAASIAQRDGAQQVAPCPTCGVTGQNTPCHHHIYDPRG